MNLSLIITIVLIAIVIPWLWRRLFPQTHASSSEIDWLTPAKADAPESRKLEENIHEQSSILNDPILVLPQQAILSENTVPDMQQKDLLTHCQFYTIQVVAGDDQVFIGYDLLQALQNIGFEYGCDDLFHFYVNEDNDEILFSVASSTAPGTFDMQTIGAFITPGLTLFFDRRFIENPENVYSKMLEIAERLAEELGGFIKEK